MWQTNLVSSFDWVTGVVGVGEVVDLIYLDFSKVFDVVPCNILTNKLRKYGIHEITINWGHNWLKNCIQTIAINVLSNWEKCIYWRPTEICLDSSSIQYFH